MEFLLSSLLAQQFPHQLERNKYQQLVINKKIKLGDHQKVSLPSELCYSTHCGINKDVLSLTLQQVNPDMIWTW